MNYLKIANILLGGALLLGGCAKSPDAPDAKRDEALMRGWIKTLAADEFGGRKPMTEYEDLTVKYLSGELNKLGLEPAFDGSWYQPFQLISVTSAPLDNQLAVSGKTGQILKYPDDVVVWTARATDQVEIPQAEYVFCGFGITAPEYGWDDYKDIDVRGKIVIALVNDPGFYDASLFRGRNMTYYGRWLYKFEEALRHGAAGCLVVHNTEAASYGWHVCVNGHLTDNLALYNPETGNMDKAISEAKKPGFRSFSLQVRGDVKMNVRYTLRETRNVGGILRGRDDKGEMLVLSAHWDHLGIGKPDESGDNIYNGAADNASGMAGALLCARRFSRLPERPKRSILFFFPSSEESGLFGSEYYCAHPVVPMEKTVADINFESIGPAELTRELSVLGGEGSPLSPYFEKAASAQGRTIFFNNDNSNGWFFRSDHYNFVKKGVPAVVWENGRTPVDPGKPNKYPMPVWYHKPCDEYHEDWDLSGTLANVNLVYDVSLALAND